MSDLPARYEANGNSACGGFSSVHFYTDTHLDRTVAVKSIKEISEQHRIVDELNALMQLRSKHVVQVFDRVIVNDVIYIIQEYIDGDDLFTSSIPKSSQDEYLKTLWQIASGIADIHSVGVIHRDIKPNNMKFDSEGIIKIFDFGLSRNEDKNAQTIGFKGTRGYAAPELIRHGNVTFSQAIDTYAFGSVAIAISGIKLPNELQCIPPQPLPDGFMNSLPFLPVELVQIITSCLDFNSDNRSSMIKVRDEIERYLLKDKHQALAVHNNKPYVFNTDKRSVSLDVPNIGNLTINYNGLRFYVSQVSGEVFINNQSTFIGQEIPKSSVITLGDSYRGNARKYITFDISNPEVVL